MYFDKKFKPLLEAYASSIGVSATPYIPPQIYFPNNMSDDGLFVHPNYAKFYLPEYRFPYNFDPEISERFLDILDDYGPKKSVATTPNPNNLSPRVKEILARRKKTEN